MEHYKDIVVLVEALRRREETAYAYLYDKYSAALYGMIFKIVDNEDEASDLLQDTIVTIWQKIELYQSDKGTLFTWMLNIARNKAIDRGRKNGKMPKIQIEGNVVSNIEQTVSNDALEINPDTVGLKELVDGLKPELKEMIELHYYQGLTHQEITDLKQIPLGTVKTRIRTAMQQLKSIFNL